MIDCNNLHNVFNAFLGTEIPSRTYVSCRAFDRCQYFRALSHERVGYLSLPREEAPITSCKPCVALPTAPWVVCCCTTLTDRKYYLVAGRFLMGKNTSIETTTVYRPTILGWRLAPHTVSWDEGLLTNQKNAAFHNFTPFLEKKTYKKRRTAPLYRLFTFMNVLIPAKCGSSPLLKVGMVLSTIDDAPGSPCSSPWATCTREINRTPPNHALHTAIGSFRFEVVPSSWVGSIRGGRFHCVIEVYILMISSCSRGALIAKSRKPSRNQVKTFRAQTLVYCAGK